MKSRCCNYKLKQKSKFYICELCNKPSDPKEWSKKTIKIVNYLKKGNII